MTLPCRSLFSRSLSGALNAKNLNLKVRFLFQTYHASASTGTEKENVLKFPVAIVGGGPVGLAASAYLSLYGVPHILLEGQTEFTNHPQAHFINNRTMEMLRPIGVAAAVSATAPPLDQWRRFIYCSSILGSTYGVVDHFDKGQTTPFSAGRPSPEPLAHLPQHRLVPLMWRAAADLARRQAPGRVATASPSALLMGAHVSRIDGLSGGDRASKVALHFRLHDDAKLAVGFGGEAPRAGASETEAAMTDSLTDAREDSDFDAIGAESVLRLLGRIRDGPRNATSSPSSSNASASMGRAFSVDCDYLIAADGVRSLVRKELGVSSAGRMGLQHLINVHFRSRRLGERLLREGRAAMLFFAFNAEVVAVVVAHDIKAGEFVAQVPFFPPVQSAEQFIGAAEAARLVRAAAGDNSIDVEVLEARPWVMSAAVAERYSSACRRAHLVGDAAHRFPPAGGFGMNTGIQDAANLAWKLAAVVRGFASNEILDSFGAERRRIAAFSAQLSQSNWKEAVKIPQLLGLDPRAASLLTDVATMVPLPNPMKRFFLEGGLSFGRWAAAASTQVPILSQWQRQEMDKIFRTGASLRLQYPAEDLGYSYADISNAAVVLEEEANGASAKCPRPAPEAFSRGRPYTPSTAPGHRLPHVWLKWRLAPVHDSSSEAETAVVDADAAPLPDAHTNESSQQGDAPFSSIDVVTRSVVGPRLVLLVDGYGLPCSPSREGSGDGGAIDSRAASVDSRNGGAGTGDAEQRNPWLVAVEALLRSRRSGHHAATKEEGSSKSGLTAAFCDSESGSSSSPLWVIRIASGAGVENAAAEETEASRLAHVGCALEEFEELSGSESTMVDAALDAAYIFAASQSPDVGELPASGSSAAGRSAPAVVNSRRQNPPFFGLKLGSALLVRPDGHVAWRHEGPPTDAEQAARVLQQVLGRLHWRSV